jgi:hypothetical protein
MYVFLTFIKKLNTFFITNNQTKYPTTQYIQMINKVFSMPHVHDIKYFLAPGKVRGDNAMSNSIRENVICNYDKCLSYKADTEYGKHWTGLLEDLHKNLHSLCDIPYQDLILEPMGGMKHNYDFNLSFMGLNKELISKIKLEFKHNTSNVTSLPQFLELHDKKCIDQLNICGERYAEYYYDHWLDKYLAIDNDVMVLSLKPDKDTYLKYVGDNKPKHVFFHALYVSYEKHKNEKRKLAQVSIRQYLEKYIDLTSLVSTFNFDKIAQKIKDSQTDKVYLLWDCTKFHTQVVNIANIKMKKIIKLNNLCFDVEVENFIYNIQIRINWGNNAGIANPRWKFSFINK